LDVARLAVLEDGEVPDRQPSDPMALATEYRDIDRHEVGGNRSVAGFSP
jgi:hypothetical protein